MLLKSSRWYSRFFKVLEILLPSLPYNLIFLLNLMLPGIKPWNIRVFRLCNFINMSEAWKKLKIIYSIINHRGICTGRSVYVRKTRAFIPTEDRKECWHCFDKLYRSNNLSGPQWGSRVCSEAKHQLRILTEAPWRMHPSMNDRFKGCFFFFFYVQKPNIGKKTNTRVSFTEKSRPAVQSVSF